MRPPGFRFVPADAEIILCYLFNKANYLPLPSTDILHDCDLYGDDENWKNKFLDQTPKREVFFFSKLRKKFAHGSRINRVSSTGTWKETQKEKNIIHKAQIIGTKHCFKFLPKKGFSADQDKDRWLMEEFRVAGVLLDKVKDSSFVVCRVERKNQLPSRIRDKEYKKADSRMLEVVPSISTLSLQSNNGYIEPTTMMPSTTTQVIQQIETQIDKSTTMISSTTTEVIQQTEAQIENDLSDGNLWIFSEDLEDLLSSL